DDGAFNPGAGATPKDSKDQADIDAWDIPQFPGLSDEDAGASPSITLNKVVNNITGTAVAANFTISATCVAGTGCTTALSGPGPTVGPTAKLSGIYTLNDVGSATNAANTYTKGTWTCTGTGNFFVGPTTGGVAGLAVGKGASVSCSITNTK